jgi:hypothetical protein
MTMARFRTRTALISAFSLFLSIPAMAQDKPKDDALDRLLEKLEGNKPAPEAESAPKPKKDDAKKDAPKADKAKTADKAKPKAKPAAEAEPKDKALDSLLEKLGETKEAPKTTGAAGAPNDADKDKDKPAKGQEPEDKTASMIKAGEKPLDEHLEELTGRVKKKKGQQGQQGQAGQQGEEGADEDTPIGRAVKKMRQVETKLGDDDTGEETRKTQGEIVKDLDQMIAQAKRSSQMQRKPGKPRPGQPQPGDQQGDQPGAQGNNAQGAKPMKTIDPKNKSQFGGDKNTWGNLPANVRDEMENVFRTEPLPAKLDRISKYYKAVAKKGMSSRGS